MKTKLLLSLLVCACAVSVARAASITDPGTHYATDAFPGFDADKDLISPARKEPRWFAFVTGPKCETAADQMAYCRTLEAEENWSKAVKHYDALVRNWPAAPEAPEAQRRLAEILLEKEDDAEEAFAEYRYLADFYSFSCDYNATVDKMYAVAGELRRQGKTFCFFRFKNTVDVRRAFEACVLRAPGASWAPAALLTVGELREEEQKYAEAVAVYENLRNLHYGTPEAKEGVAREASVRMRLLREHGYNRARCRDTIGFLELARTLVAVDRVDEVDAFRKEAEAVLEDEAYRAACFYDSRTRTTRSAVNAYERFLAEYPSGVHAEEIRARLDELKQKGMGHE